MGIGHALQQLIQERKTNVNEVATATGVNPQTIYSIIKRDSAKANIDDLYRIASYLGTDLNYFYCVYCRGKTDVSPTVKVKAPSPQFQQLQDNWEAMNDAGHEKLLDYSRLLLNAPQYLACGQFDMGAPSAG